MGWQLTAASNVITSIAYFGICFHVLRGLIQTQQVRTNRLALATAAIFLTCALHHGEHAAHLVFGSSPEELAAIRGAFGELHAWLLDVVTATVGVFYLGLRRSYGVLLRSPAMFDVADYARYRQLAANLPNTSVLVFDNDLRAVLAEGKELREAPGVAGQLEGRLLSEALPAESFALLEPRCRAALRGEASDYDQVSPHTGKTFRIRTRPLLRDSEDGIADVQGGLFLCEDVTTERAAQTQLASTRAFADAVLQASPDTTTITDLVTGRVTWSSRSLEEMLGWTNEDGAAAHSAGFDPLVAVEDQARVRVANAAVQQLASGESITVRYRLPEDKGGHRWVSRRTTPYERDDSGAVLTGLSVVREVTEDVAAEVQLRHAALHDPLTGLPNRALLVDRVTSAIARSDREDAEVGVLFCDLDGFKRVNDTDGHAAGDAVLVEVAERLQGVLRKGDSIARVGGDEFVIVLEPGHAEMPQPHVGYGEPGCETGTPPGGQPVFGAREIGELVMGRIQAALATPIRHHEQQYVISASVGMTFARRGSVAEDVLRDADAAMYLAKQRGKNRFEVFDDALRADVVERGRIEHALRMALNLSGDPHPRLSVAYQPVCDLTTGTLVGFEALARLSTADAHFVPPDSFIPIAEDTGLISDLGERVLDSALETLVRWRADSQGETLVTMAVNVSARQAQQGDLPTIVSAALRRHGLCPSDLTLELTESIMLEAGSSTLRQLTELHESGVGISIDDFGTGYASLRYLATLPVSSVKVDKSFTTGLPTDATSVTIVRAVASLAANLGLACIIEGIETEQQLSALPPGVLGQGYLLGRPTAEPQDNWQRARTTVSTRS